MAVRKKKVSKALVVTKKKRNHSVSKSARAQKNKAINQQLLREQIAAGNHHHQIVKTLGDLEALDAEVKKTKSMDRSDQAKAMTRLGILKTKLDTQFKLLNKYLPDLRSLEFKDGEGNNPFATAAAAWAEALKEK